MKRALILTIFAMCTVAGCQHDVILGNPPTDLATFKIIDMTMICGLNGCADLTSAVPDLGTAPTPDLAQ